MNLRFESPFDSEVSPPSRSVSARDPLTDQWIVRVGGGSETLFVDRAAVPQEVRSGGVLDVEVDVVNTALVISPTDADHCSEGGVGGYEYEVEVSPSWTTAQAQTECLPAGGNVPVGDGRETHQFSFQTPQQGGTYTIDITVTGTGTGFSGGGTRQLVVADSNDDTAPVRPEPPQTPIGGGGDGVDLGGGINQGLVISVLLLLLLLVVGISIGG